MTREVIAKELGYTIHEESRLVRSSSGEYYMRKFIHVVNTRTNEEIKFRDSRALDKFLEQLMAAKPAGDSPRPKKPA